MSCLFDSLSNFLLNNQNQKIDPHELRQTICDFLENNPKIMDEVSISDITQWESNIPLKDYIKKMRLDSTWGGAIEIRCFCIMFKTNIVVHLNNKEIVFNSPDKSKTNIHLHYTGSHFTPIKLEKII